MAWERQGKYSTFVAAVNRHSGEFAVSGLFTDSRILREQRLRYKDYTLLCSEGVEQGRLLVKDGDVKEFYSLKALAHDLGERGILDWWKLHMGFTKGKG